MKRADIKAGPVYGYSEDRAHIWRYSPVIVLSTDLYMIQPFGDRTLVPADQYHQAMQTGRGYSGNAVGMLTVHLYQTSAPDLAKVARVATAEAAVAGINGEGRDVVDPDDSDRILGHYRLLTKQRYLHGDYFALTAGLEAAKRKRQEYADAAEQNRLARLATYRALNARLTALGITGYDVADWENKSYFEGLTFDDMDALLCLAEAGKEYQQATNDMMP